MKSIAMRFVSMEVCNSIDILKQCSQKIPKLNYFIRHLCPNRIGYFKERFGSGIDFGGRECMVPPDPFLLVHVDS